MQNALRCLKFTGNIIPMEYWGKLSKTGTVESIPLKGGGISFGACVQAEA